MKSFDLVVENAQIEKVSVFNSSQPFFVFQSGQWIMGDGSGLAIALLLSWVAGLPAKHAILKSIFLTGLKTRPVNMLILVEQLVNLLHRSMTLIGLVVVLLTKTPLESMFKKNFGLKFCPVFTRSGH